MVLGTRGAVFLNCWYLEDGNNVDSIYLDFAKAFDKVDIGIHCHKLKKMRLTGNLGIFLHSFLSFWPMGSNLDFPKSKVESYKEQSLVQFYSL